MGWSVKITPTRPSGKRQNAPVELLSEISLLASPNHHATRDLDGLRRQLDDRQSVLNAAEQRISAFEAQAEHFARLAADNDLNLQVRGGDCPDLIDFLTAATMTSRPAVVVRYP
jgi:hypothetical protein